MKNAEEVIEWIHSLMPLGIKPGLKRMEWMLERLDHPERRLSFIHVAGTNGKGSTASFMASVLQEAGYRVGMFTSPYVETFHDRIRFNGEFISGEELVIVANQIRPLVEELASHELGSPTEFEVITTMAMLYFASMKVPDFVVWETGLGGRLDSTNVVRPLVSIITNVGYDHMNILGDTLEDIAREKSGIIKPGVPVVTGETNPVPLQVIQEVAAQQKAALYQAGKQFNVERLSLSSEEQTFVFKGPYRQYRPVTIRLLGPHQLSNAGNAIMALELLRQFYAVYIEEEHIIRGMAAAFWPGRFEKLEQENMPVVVLDGAHNSEGVRSLAATIEELYSEHTIHLHMAVLKDKNWDDIVSPLLPLCHTITVSEVNHPRKAEADQVAEFIKQKAPECKVTAIPNGRDALESIIRMAEPRELVLITGSLYFVSEMRDRCLQLFEEAGVKQ
ncbi:MAG: bifunctional folylpolyglutamate synthase/dihydrofolate synthase [Bacillaceae bacterium]|nr:bifunctional folylpolyglutamate synthase/dihydrofolate synthase [Bacillaceae bacterium]